MNSEPGGSDPHPDTQFSEYAQNRVVTGTRGVSRDELRDLITEHGCWGRTLADFQDLAGVRISGTRRTSRSSTCCPARPPARTVNPSPGRHLGRPAT